MLRINKFLTLLVLVALLVSACQPIVAPGTMESGLEVVPATGEGLRPDAPDYALRGPYAVGTRDFVLKTG